MSTFDPDLAADHVELYRQYIEVRNERDEYRRKYEHYRDNENALLRSVEAERDRLKEENSALRSDRLDKQ